MAVHLASARSKRPRTVPAPELESAAPALGSPALGYSVGVRAKFGDELEGLDMLPDGLVFRSPVALQPGKTLELILCRGSMLVDAIVVQCTRLRDEQGGFAIHTRYHHVSEALASLIREEVARLTGRPELFSP
jgi:hypothetical protein